MNYLTHEQVLFLHYRLIEETGGSHGISNVGLLQSAIARPAATFDNNDLYPDLFSKVAALMHSIINNHPFVDGNKRTAISAASIFLLRNNYILTVSNIELEQFTLRVASTDTKIEEISEWFTEHSKKIKI